MGPLYEAIIPRDIFLQVQEEMVRRLRCAGGRPRGEALHDRAVDLDQRIDRHGARHDLAGIARYEKGERNDAGANLRRHRVGVAGAVAGYRRPDATVPVDRCDLLGIGAGQWRSFQQRTRDLPEKAVFDVARVLCGLKRLLVRRQGHTRVFLVRRRRAAGTS